MQLIQLASHPVSRSDQTEADRQGSPLSSSSVCRTLSPSPFFSFRLLVGPHTCHTGSTYRAEPLNSIRGWKKKEKMMAGSL